MPLCKFRICQAHTLAARMHEQRRWQIVAVAGFACVRLPCSIKRVRVCGDHIMNSYKRIQTALATHRVPARVRTHAAHPASYCATWIVPNSGVLESSRASALALTDDDPYRRRKIGARTLEFVSHGRVRTHSKSLRPNARALTQILHVHQCCAFHISHERQRGQQPRNPFRWWLYYVAVARE